VEKNLTVVDCTKGNSRRRNSRGAGGRTTNDNILNEPVKTTKIEVPKEENGSSKRRRPLHSERGDVTRVGGKEVLNKQPRNTQTPG